MYCYKKENNGFWELIQIVPSSTLFTRICYKHKGYCTYIINLKNGYIIEDLYIQIKPISNCKEMIIKYSDFVIFITKVLQDPLYKDRIGYRVYIEKENSKLGPYKSLNYVCKNVLNNANWDTVKKHIDENRKYIGYTITIY